MRTGGAVLVLAACGALASVAVPSSWSEPIPGRPVVLERTVVETVTVQARAGGHSAAFWRWQDAKHRRALNHAKLSLGRANQRNRRERLLSRRRYAPTVSYAIRLAAAVYGVDQTRRVHCESHGDVYAHNPSGASGLLQFLPSTWASTPFAGFSIYDPMASALAGGWMVAHGRSNEWSCRL